MLKILVKILQKIIVAVLIFVAVINIFVIGARLILKEDLPSVFGFTQAVVLSGSMEPVLSVGDVVIYKSRDEYEIGDVVIFHQDDYFVTHRIVGETENGFITQGDANNTADKDVLYAEMIEGEMVLALSNAGTVMNFIKTPVGIICVILLAFVIIEVPNFTKKEEEIQEKEGTKDED